MSASLAEYLTHESHKVLSDINRCRSILRACWRCPGFCRAVGQQALECFGTIKSDLQSFPRGAVAQQPITDTAFEQLMMAVLKDSKPNGCSVVHADPELGNQWQQH